MEGRSSAVAMASFVDKVGPDLADTVHEVSLVSDEAGGQWVLRAEADGYTVDISCAGGVWFVEIDGWCFRELWPEGESNLPHFLASMDVHPLFQVTATVGSRDLRSWPEFGNGVHLEDFGLSDRLARRRRTYRQTRTPWADVTPRQE